MPTPDDNNNAKSAMKARTGSYKPASSSSEKKQKDQLHLQKSSDSDVSVEEAIVVATSTDKTDLQNNTLSQANTNKEQLATSFSELSSFTPPPEVDCQDLKSSVSSTALSSSSSSITTTASPSTSSAMNIFDFSLPSPTNSIFNEALSNQLNHSESIMGLDPIISQLLIFYSDITQKAPPPRKAIDPTTPPVLGLCLPPMAAAKVAKVPSDNFPTIADYTLSDIESLLTTDNVNPSSLQNQTEELSWMEDYNDLFM